MRKLIAFSLLSIVFLSCKKESTPEKANENLPAGTVLASGVFAANSHPTSGTAKVIQDGSGKKHLVLENFKTDNGPDLRVWISPTITASPYAEIGLLKAVNGSFSYELPSSASYSTHNRVLIWCEDFSVLFGHAVLQ